MKPFTYESMFVPVEYLCSSCKIHGLKLWRQYNTFKDYLQLTCAKCANPSLKLDIDGRHKGEYGTTDQIEDVAKKTGSLVPAVPTIEGDKFWGYTTVPLAGCAWWRALPTYQENSKRPFYISPDELAEEKKYKNQEEEWRRKSLKDRQDWRKRTVYCIEATDYEQHMLWCQHASAASLHSYISRPRLLLMGKPSVCSYSEDELFDRKLFALAEKRLHAEMKVEPHSIKWEQISIGEMVRVNPSAKRPTCISVSWAKINDKVIMFYWPTSQLVDWKLVDEWLKKEYAGRPKTDAQNFHNCLMDLK